MSRETKSGPDRITKKGLELLISRISTSGLPSTDRITVETRRDRHVIKLECFSGDVQYEEELVHVHKKGVTGRLRGRMFVRIKPGARWEKTLRELIGEILRVYGNRETSEVGRLIYDKHRDSEETHQVYSIPLQDG